MVCSNPAHLYLPYYRYRASDVYLCVCVYRLTCGQMCIWICAWVCVRECTYMHMCKYTHVQRPENNPVFSQTLACPLPKENHSLA